MANPVKNPNPPDFEPDGTWYSMITARGDGHQVDLYAVEPNHGELDRITPDGQISRVADLSASYGHIVPTAIATGDNDKFYVGSLGISGPGSAKIYEISKDGHTRIVAEGLDGILGVALDSRHRIYALETTDATGAPGTGKVIRVDPSGTKTEIASGLFLPSAMTFGPDGALYVSNVGFGPPPDGEGQVLRITVP
jgi:hypothetical protein